MAPAPLLYVALDDASRELEQTNRMARRLANEKVPFGFKINLDYLLQRGLEIAIESVDVFNRPIFVDLKMWNGKRTMADVLRPLARNANVHYVTVHALADTELKDAVSRVTELGTGNLKVAGTTILTHYSEEFCQHHFRRTRAEAVRHFAEVAVEAGCRAIVLPGQYLDLVRDLPVDKIVPGIREEGGSKDGRHDVEVTPTYARDHGANVVVCGSPFAKADNPVEVLHRIYGALQPAT